MTLFAQFEEFLTKEKKVSQKTLRNYRADLNHFLRWADIAGHQLLDNFSPSLVGRYKGFHLETKVPMSTANRRLSTLRNFSRFLQESGFSKVDPTEVIENLKSGVDEKQVFKKIIADFKKHLEDQKLSKSTLKNYMSDTRQFFTWIQGTTG